MKRQKGNGYFNFISKDIDNDFYDLLLYNVNNFLYNYSDHLKENSNRKRKLDIIKKFVFIFVKFYFIFKNKFIFRDRTFTYIMSNAYVNISFSCTHVVLPPWNFSLNNDVAYSFSINRLIEKIKNKLDKRSVKVLLSDEFKLLIRQFEDELLKLFRIYNIRILIVPNDMSFFENISIKIAKKHNIPSFVYLHGLPARYNLIDDNRADYLIVWGNGIKNEYKKVGVSPNKILTLKHPYYSDFQKINLESSLDNILVVSKAVAGTPSSSNKLSLSNRSNSLLYLEYLKVHLKRMGVNFVNLRLHPSESREFYENSLPDDFFIIDESLKEESLSKASLVIGPTSTMVLDSIKSGKNYILFDPIFDGITLDGLPLVGPFDGETFIKLSNSFDDILYNINNPESNICFNKLNDFFAIDSSDEGKILDILNEKK